jgi:transposase
MEPTTFFTNPPNTAQKQYEALRSFYLEKCSGEEVAKRFGYTLSSFYSLTRDFKKILLQDKPAQFFFTPRTTGRKPMAETDKINQLIVDLRKRYLSVPDIKAIVDAQGEHTISESHIYNVIKSEGFARLPRRKNGSSD